MYNNSGRVSTTTLYNRWKIAGGGWTATTMAAAYCVRNTRVTAAALDGPEDDFRPKPNNPKI